MPKDVITVGLPACLKNKASWHIHIGRIQEIRFKGSINITSDETAAYIQQMTKTLLLTI